MKIYISGPITNKLDYMEDFDRAEEKLWEEYPEAEIINPARTNATLPKSTTWEQYMSICYILLDMCDAIYMIDGWNKSKGAIIEICYAIKRNMKILMEKDIEEWKSIQGYDHYMVSNIGRVKTLERTYMSAFPRHQEEKTLNLAERKDGYISILLCKDGIRKTFNVHRLVADAFIPNEDSTLCVNHINEKKYCNIVSNLEWVTHKYNNSYGTRLERLRNAKTNGKTSRKVARIRNGNVLEVLPSTRECERKYGYNHARISSCCRSGQTAFGYKWKYVDEAEVDKIIIEQ